MRGSSMGVIVLLLALSLPLVVGVAPAVAQADWLQVWAVKANTEYVDYVLQYRDAAGNMLVSYELPNIFYLESNMQRGGRLAQATVDLVRLFDPMQGTLMDYVPPTKPANLEGEFFMVSRAVYAPDGQRLAYNVTRQPADFNDLAETILYVGMPNSSNHQIVLQEQHEASYAIEPVAWGSDGQRLLIHKMPQGIGGYILFWTYREVRVLDVNTGSYREVGEVDGFMPDFSAFADLTTDADYNIAGISITDFATGATAGYNLPALPEQVSQGGGAFFSPNGRQLAYQVARGNPESEKFWTILVDRTTGQSRVLYEEEGSGGQMDYGNISGWLDDSTLVLGSLWGNKSALIDVQTGTVIREENAVFLGYADGLTDTTGFASPTSIAPTCPGAPPSRLRLTQRGRVTFTDGTLTNVRDRPNVSGTKIATIPEGTEFTVLEGPGCSDGYAWWRLEFDDGLIGWVAEGTPDSYFLEPWQ